MAQHLAARGLPASTTKHSRKSPALSKTPGHDAAWLDRELKRVTAKALDELKLPTAIPSQVILKALLAARKI